MTDDVVKKLKAVNDSLEHLQFTMARTNELLAHIRAWLIAGFLLFLFSR